MKRVAMWICATLLLLAALLFLSGLALPREHRATSCITLEQPAESLWAATRNIGGTGAWWPEMVTAKRVDSAGQERWLETIDDFTMTVRVEETSPGEEFHTVIESPPGSAFGGRWIYRVAPSSVGNSVCVTEEGWIGNPGFRAVASLMGFHGTLDSYLTALAGRFGVSYQPEHLD